MNARLWVIVNDTDDGPLYWSKQFGWGHLWSCDKYPEADKVHTKLAQDMRWESLARARLRRDSHGR